MKRMYFALALVILCIVMGIVEKNTISYSAEQCLNKIKSIEIEIDNKNYKEAESICKKATDEYEKFASNVIYCYYPHNELDQININLSVMVEALNNNDINRYHAIKEKTKKQLASLKDAELFNIQNIL